MLNLRDRYDEKDAGWLFTVFIGALMIVSLVLNYIIQFIALFSEKSFDEIFHTPAATWTMQGVLYVFLAFVVFFYHKKNGISLIKANGLDKKLKVLDYIVAVALGVGMLFAFLIFTFLFSYFLQQVGYKDTASYFKVDSVGTFILGIIIIGVLPAVTEEIVFRGAVFKGYSKVFKVIPAVLLSALFFMLMHMNVPQFINALLTGILMAFIVKFTGNVLVTMIMHFINNFTIILLTYIESFNSEQIEDELIVLNSATITPYLIYFGIGCVLLALGIVYFYIKRDKSKIEEEKEAAVTVFEETAPVVIKQHKDKPLRLLSHAAIGFFASLLVIILNLVFA